MGGLRSLGLAGARKVLRKLFRRHTCENNDDQATNTNSTISTTKSEEDRNENSCQQPFCHSVTTGAGSASVKGAASSHYHFQEGSEGTQGEAGQKQQPDGEVSSMTTTTKSLSGPVWTPTTYEEKQYHALKETRCEEKPHAKLPPVASSGLDLVTKSLKDLDLDLHRKTGVEVGPDNKLITPELDPVIGFDPKEFAERQKHLRFIGEALDMARLALITNETPVGCVLVHQDRIIARGMNATNVTRNGTRHAELMAISALLSYAPKTGPKTTSLRPKDLPLPSRANPLASPEEEETPTVAAVISTDPSAPDEGNQDGRKGHLYPYGQKDIEIDRVDRSILRECILYVTVEPCIMCASLLRQLGIKKVYFGAVNDKFGGTGGVFSIHANSIPVAEGGESKAAHPTPRPTQLPDGSGILGCLFPTGGGDGGNVEDGFAIEGGWGRDDAVGLLRRFYVQENGRAPIPRKKEGRAARLAAMMEQDGAGTAVSDAALADATDDIIANDAEVNLVGL